MVHISSFFRLLCLIVPLYVAFPAQAQRPPATIVYDSLGRPVRNNHEIIVNFSPSAINLAAVSSRAGDEGPLSNFLKPAVGRALESSLGIPLATIYAIKVVASMTPADSLSTDRSGNPITVPPLWSRLLLCVPNEIDDYALLDRLNQQKPTVLAAFFNIIFLPQSGSSRGLSPFLLGPGAAQPLVYPLPAQDLVTFALPQPLPATAEIMLMTPAGKVVHTEKHKVYQHSELTPLQINLSSIPAGHYFYRLTTPTATYHGRIEKQD